MEEPIMRKPTRLPREQASSDGLGADGSLPAGTGPTDQDVEGHNRLPGTGGDIAPRLPGGGGELTPQFPGTGGDFRRPSGGGEATDDDIEGHDGMR
jgi:hypothetical protein